VAQVAVGLLLLADHRHADNGVHYMYGSLAVLAVRGPGSTRRLIPGDGWRGSPGLPCWQPCSPSAPT
jgi:hypothetical protein